MHSSKYSDVIGLDPMSYSPDVHRPPATRHLSCSRTMSSQPHSGINSGLCTFSFVFEAIYQLFQCLPEKRRFLSDRAQQQKGAQRFLWILSSFNMILWTVVIAVANHSHCFLLCFYLPDTKPKLKEKLTCLTCFILCKRTAYNSLEENTELKI